MIVTTVNASYKEVWSEEKLAEIVKNMTPPPSERIYVLFTEVPLQSLLKWCLQQNIDFDILKHYYEKYIKPLYQNKELEEFLDNAKLV